jgi:hypothetical protein
MAMTVSSKVSSQGIASPSPPMFARSPGTTQKKAAPAKTARTIFSPWLIGPRSSIWSSIIALPPGTSVRWNRTPDMWLVPGIPTCAAVESAAIPSRVGTR